MTDESILKDDSIELNDADSVSDAFLKQWEVAETDQPAEDADEGAKDHTNEGTSDDHETIENEELVEDDGETQEDPQSEVSYIDNEDARVKIKVGDNEIEASVKDLKRLYGQEASLTHKSQEVANQRKVIEEKAAQYETALETLVNRAADRYAPYAKIDFLVAAKQLDADELSALRQEALKAYEDYNFLKTELGSVQTKKAEATQAAFVEKAKKTIEVLSNPEQGIPGWSENLYNDIRVHSVANGMDAQEFNQITDPFILKTLWKAMRYDKATKLSSKKVASSPKKVLSSKAPAASRSQQTSEGAMQAMGKLRNSGSRDDAANAFLARWETSD